MPLDFPDMQSLVNRAKLHGFREPIENEREDEYRNALADFVEPIDFIESIEIRNKIGWDKFSDEHNSTMIQRFLRNKEK